MFRTLLKKWFGWRPWRTIQNRKPQRLERRHRLGLGMEQLETRTVPAVLFSDSFNRADTAMDFPADNAFGGSGSHYYTDVFTNGASIISNALQNNLQDFGGVQVSTDSTPNTTFSLSGENLGQDLNMKAQVLVPKTASGDATQAGFFFRSRNAFQNDGIIGGTSHGYWVILQSTGDVWVKPLQATSSSFDAWSGRPASFDSTVSHSLEIAVSGTTLQVALDGKLLTFKSASNGGGFVTTVTLPTQPSGTNSGTGGIAFGAEPNRGLAGGQRVDDFIVSTYSTLTGLPVQDNFATTLDYGDAPDTAGTGSNGGTATTNYNTLTIDNGPSHVIVAGLRIGATVDGENNATPNSTATGDDVTGSDDEDGISTPLRFLVGQTPSIQVNVTNTTGSAATLYGWIDYNNDGRFDNATERAMAAVADGMSGSVTLNFSTILSSHIGSKFARFRLSTDGAAQNAVGAAMDGEVEDYAIEFGQPFTVTNLNDSGAGSLRQAVINANAAAGLDVITFTGAATSGTITLTTGAIAIAGSVDIQGPGATALAISGNNASRIFVLNGGTQTTRIAGLTMTRGNAQGGAGGALAFNENPHVTIEDSVITGNTAGSGGGLAHYTGYMRFGSVTVRNTTISNNTATQSAGSTRGGGAIYMHSHGAPLVVENSTISGNTSYSGGGGIYILHGGATIRNSTISGNTALTGSHYSGAGGGGIMVDGSLTVQNSTISGNTASAGQGGGIKAAYGTTVLESTILANNTDTSAQGDDLHRSVGTVHASNSLFEVTPVAGHINGTNTANIFGVDPLLGPLASQGGLTKTYALLTGSPAIGAGSNPAGLTTDQRGFTRAVGAVDIGAYELQTTSFQTAVNYGTGDGPQSIAVGDFNGDGKTDVATANRFSSKVSILLGTGTGTLGTAVDYNTGPTPYSIAVGDFNADGKADLVTANFSGNNVSVLLGTGTGTFGAPTNFGVGLTPFSVAVGDFNADGKSDLAVANANSASVSVLMGTGTGSFGGAVNYGTASGPQVVAVGDFNADGKPDLAVGNVDVGTVSVLLNNGTGTFAAAVNYGVGNAPFSIGVGDFNADGKADLAVGNVGNDNVSILLNNGTGTFAAAVNYSVGDGPQSIGVADFNGDGKLDLAVANSGTNNVSILQGNGNGTFQTAVNFGAATGPQSLAVGDFNADSKPDVAVANLNVDNVSILLNNSTPPPVTSGNLSADLIGGNLIITDVDSNSKNNAITVSRSGSDLVITDATEQFQTAPPGGVLSNGNKTVTISMSLVTGFLGISSQGGSDTLTVNFTGGNPIPTGGIVYDGASGTSDTLSLVGGTTNSMTQAFTSANDGSITFAGTLAGTISYTGLEPITSTMTTAVVTLNYSGGTETITVTDAGGGQTTVDSTLGEISTFNNPTSTLVINANNGTDTLNISSLATNYAGLTITGDDATDVVNVNGAITLASGFQISVNTGVINTAAAISTTGAASAVSLIAKNGVTLNAGVTTGGGTVSLTADNDANGTGTMTLAAAVIGNWSQQQQLNASGGAAGDFFGASVAVSTDGNTAIVGASNDDVGANGNQGTATVFIRSGGVWVQQQQLTASGGDLGDTFGISVALSSDGNTAIVGAAADTVGANTSQGSARVFIRVAGVWTEQQQLTAADGAAGDGFGFSVALSSDGNTAIVGAYSDTVGGISAQGSAIVFTRSGSVWTQQQQLTGTGGGADDHFGVSVALSSDGNTAIVGAEDDDVGANVSQGTATVFTRSAGVWTQQQQLTGTGVGAGDRFGSSVALSSDGNTAIVGADGDTVGANVTQGTATVFTRSAGVWTQQQQLTATGGGAGDAFGTSVALSSDGNKAIVGAWLDDVGANTNQGTATVFTRSGGVWAQQQQLTATGGAANDLFGNSVALSGDGNTAFVGDQFDAVGVNSNQGSVYTFTFTPGVIGGSISSGAGVVAIVGGDADIQGTITTTGAATVTVATSQANRPINLGTETAGSLSLTDTELDRITASRIIVGVSNAGNVTFSAPIALANSNALEVITGSTINDTGSTTVFTDTSLALNASGGVGTTSTLNVAVSNLAANGGSGGVNVSNTGSLTVTQVGGVTGASATNSNISITASSFIQVTSAVSTTGAGSVIIDAQGGINGDLSIQAGISTVSGGITLRATDDLSANPTGTITTTSASSLNIVADFDADGQGFLLYQGNVDHGSIGSTWSVGTAGGSMNGLVSGSGALTKNGAGILTLGATNSYTGATRINAGTLSVSSLANGGVNSRLGASSNAATNLILDGGTLRYTGVGAGSTNRLFSVGTSGGTIESTSGGTLNFTNTGALGFNSQSGARTLTLGQAAFGSGFSPAIGDNGGATSLLVTGTSSFWELKGNNTYSGTTTVSGGEVYITSDGNLGAAPGSATPNEIVLTSNGGLFAASGNVSINSNRGIAIGPTSGTGSARLGALSGTLNYGGIITNNSVGTGNLVKAGVGALALSGANTYSGHTDLVAGTLSVSALANGGVASPLGQSSSAASNLRFSAGTLEYTGTGHSTDRLFQMDSNGATISANGAGLLDFTNPGSIAIGATGSKTITLTGAGQGTFSPVVGDPTSSGTSAITKVGTGTWTLNGGSTYTGTTTINGGRLNVNGSLVNGAAADDVLVNSGGTLGGTGAIFGKVQVNSGGIVAPGNSPGILNVDSISYSSGSTLAIEIGGVLAGNNPTNHDQIEVTGVPGPVSLGGATLSLLSFNSFVPFAGQTFTIINNAANDAITGTFNGLAEGGTITNFLGSGRNATITYQGGTGNDVVLTVLNVAPVVTPPANQNATAGVSQAFNLGSFSDLDAAPWNVVVDWGDPSWSSAASLATARNGHMATLLPNGKILVTGGFNLSSGFLSSAELYDPGTNSWSAAASVPIARASHTATLLSFGRVLVAGGVTNGSYLSDAEIYDPVSNSWSGAGAMGALRSGHTATLLNSGKVLVTGGRDAGGIFGSAELYDPNTNSWSSGGSMGSPRLSHTATLLGNGKVLVVGGSDGSGPVSSAVLYDPATNSWSAVAPLAATRSSHTATLLGNGKVLVAGGGIGAATEVYDPVANSWASAGSLAANRVSHTATLLGNGKVLVAGGQGDGGVTLSSAELYDPLTNSWSSTTSMSGVRKTHTATLLGNGKVLLAAGTNPGYISSAELYDPNLTSFTVSSAGSLGTQNHTYPTVGNYTATITVTDPFGVSGSATFQVAVASSNVAPWITLNPVTAINENGIATLTGTINDANVADTFNLQINWGDPASPNNVENYPFAASATGTQSFTLTHQYLDDNPTGTSSDQYAISATLTDNNGGTATATSTPVFGYAVAQSSAGSDFTTAVTTDASGNVYTTGTLNGNLFVRKFNSAGTQLWSQQLASTSPNSASIAVDTGGNVIVTGYFTGSNIDFDPGAGTFNMTSDGTIINSANAFVLKLDTSGTFVWARRFGGNRSDGKGVGVDAAGNIYASGFYTNTGDFDTTAVTPGDTLSTSGQDGYVVKLTAAGGFVWARGVGAGGGFQDTSSELAVDASANVYVTGFFRNTADFDQTAVSAGDTLTSNGSSDAYVLKLNTNGAFQWVRGWGSNLGDNSEIRDHSNGVGVDALGNVYTTGSFEGTNVDFDRTAVSAGDLVSSVGGANVFLSKLTTAGQFVWARAWTGSPGPEVATDADGNVYTTGGFSGTVDFDRTTTYGDNRDQLTSSAASTDVFISKIDSAGNFRWAGRVGGSGTDFGNSIAIDASRSIYTSGGFNGTADFDPGAGTQNLISAGGQDGFLLKLAQASVSPSTSVTVNNVAPTFTSSPPTTAVAGQSYSYQATATDPAGANDPFTWSFAGSPPAGMTVSATGLVTWTAAVGSHPVTLRVNDGDLGITDQSWTIVVAGTTEVALSGGNLVITDADGGNTNDTLTISLNGANVRVTDPNNALYATGGASQVDANTVDVLLSSITGNIQVNTLGGNDSLSVNFAGGNPIPSGGITYDGGAGGSDSLTLTGGTTTTVTHTFTNANDGSVALSGSLSGTINYAGLEPITDNLSATDRFFTFNGGAETITLNDAVGSNNMTIDSTLGESVTFTNPTNSLTINAGTGNDGVSIVTVDPGYNASLTINGGTGDDSIGLITDITFAAGKNLDVDLQDDDAAPGVDTINVDVGVDLLLSGAGFAKLKASRNITLHNGASLRTADGNITIEANQQLTPTTGSFIGVHINNAPIQSTGSGVVTVLGKGGDSGLAQTGVLVRGNIIGGTSGTTIVTGTTSATAGSTSQGVDILGASITSNGSDVQVTGTGAGASGYGVLINASGVISAGGTGDVNITGTAASGASGVILDNGGSVTTSGGDVTITNFTNQFQLGGSGPGTVITTGAGNITIITNLIDLASGSINAGPNQVILQQRTSGQPISLGLGTSTTALALSDAELDLVTAGTIQIGAGGAGSIAVNAPVDRATANTLTLITSADINFGGSGSLNATASGFVNLNAALGSINTPAGTSGTHVTAASITLDDELRPGASPGQFVVNGNLVFGNTDKYVAELNGTTAGTQHDQIVVSGTASLGNATLEVQLGFTPLFGQQFKIVDTNGGVIGTFRDTLGNTLNEGSTFIVGGTTFQITYVGGADTKDVVLTVQGMPSIAIDNVTANETNSGTTSFTFNVTLSSASANTVTVNYQTADGTAQDNGLGEDDDYVAQTGTVTFTPGDVSEPITIQVKGDTKFESTEDFFVNLFGAVNATITDNQGQGTITNDDTAPTVSINDVTQLETNSGQTAFVFTLTLSNASSQTVSVSANTADGTAQDGNPFGEDNDYMMGAQGVTFNPGETSKQFTVLVNGDIAFEPDETFFVNLAAPLNVTIADGQGVGTITNDDFAQQLSIDNVTLAEGHSGTTAFTFTVTLTGPAATQNITVNYTTVDGNAEDGPTAAGRDADYVLQTGSLTFLVGQTQKQITIDVNGDTKIEHDETFAVRLTSATNATIVDGHGVGTITTDENAPIIPDTKMSFNTTTVAVEDPDLNGGFRMMWGPAVAHGLLFYTTQNNTFPFQAQLKMAVDPQRVTRIDEGSGPRAISSQETFALLTSGASGLADFVTMFNGHGVGTYALGGDKYRIVLPFRQGGTTLSYIQIVVQDDTINGGLIESVQTIHTSHTGGFPQTTNGRYIAFVQQTVPSENSPLVLYDINTGTLINTGVTQGFGMGVEVGGFSLDGDILAFASFENNDTFNPANHRDYNNDGDANDRVIRWLRVSDFADLDTNNNIVHVGPMIDSDSFTNNLVQLVGNDGRYIAYTLQEDGGTLNNDIDSGDRVIHFYDTLTGLTTVSRVVNGSAAAADFPSDPTAGILTFKTLDGTDNTLDYNGDGDNNDTQLRFFDINDNCLITTNITLFDQDAGGTTHNDSGGSGHTDGVIIGYRFQPGVADGFNNSGAELRIIRVNEGMPELRISDASVVEGDSGTTELTFTVSFACPTDLPVSVTYTTAPNSATPGDNDYVSETGTLSFAPGDLSKTFTITINGDGQFEPNETFFVNLTGAVNSTIADGQAIGTILNDDFAPAVAADNATVTINEGQTAVNTGTFSDADGDTVTITASVGVINQTGTNSGTWSWSFGTTSPSQSQVVTITANDGNGGVSTTTFQLTVNNVTPAIAISKTATPSSVSEGGVGNQNVTYTYDVVNTSLTSTDPLTITTLVDDNGTPVNFGDDINLLTHGGVTLTKAGGDQDNALELGETWTYTLTLTVPSKAAGQTHVNGVTVTAQDDELTSAGHSATATVTYTAARDYGDAPDTGLGTGTGNYQTTSGDSGASHVVTGPRLGANRDFEADGLPSANADGDDTNGTDDEDGVTLPATIHAATYAGNTMQVTVNLQNADPTNNRLDGWIDFNRDGDWTDPGEQVFMSQNIVAGNNTLNVAIPQATGGAVVAGTSYARFRLSTAGGLAPTGHAADGEVEDYQLNICIESASLVVTTAQDVVAIDCLTSLREAIDFANSNPDVSTITFAIPGAGVHTINLTSELPAIMQTAIIDGYSQSGAAVNTNGAGLGTNAQIMIELNGAAMFGSGLRLFTHNSTVKGLAINRFSSAGIQVGGAGHTIEGNFIGTDPTGAVDLGNQIGIFVNDPAQTPGGSTIGGTTAAARNLISGNVDGIWLDGDGDENTIVGNLIGTNAAGTNAIGNGTGISMFMGASNNQIGGTNAVSRNVISGNGVGVAFTFASTQNNRVEGNYIGTNAAGNAAVGNTTGVAFNLASNNTIGGTANGAGNLISGNTGVGVNVASGTGNSILGNSIHANGGLGIDLGIDGVTPNDLGDADTGANDLQNFPVLNAAISVAGTVTIDGSLNSTPNTTFRIEFFASQTADPSTFGEGEVFVGTTSVTTNGSGDVNFTSIFTVSVPIGQVITATATRMNGLVPADTSEFSGVRTNANNQAPVAEANGPYVVSEGGSVVLSSAGSNDPDLGIIAAYEWDFDYDGVTFNVDALGSSPTFSASTLDGTLVRNIALRVTDNFGATGIDTSTVTVENVAPQASFANGGAVNEGSPGSVTFSSQSDPSSADTTAGFRYAYDFDNNGTFEVGDGTYAGSVASASQAVPASFLADGPGTRTVKGRIIDDDGGFTDYTTDITINNVAPTVTGGPFSINENSDNGTVVGSASASDPGVDTITFSITAGNTGGAFAIDGTTGQITVANKAAVDFETTPVFNLTVRATDSDAAFGTTTVTINLNDLQAQVSVNDVSIQEGNVTTTLTFTITVGSPAVNVPFGISYATANGSAVEAVAGAGSDDYDTASGTTSFNGTAGQTQTVNVTVNGDAIVELNETFFLNLTAVTGSNDVTITDNQGQATLTNDDSATLTIGEAQVIEGDSGPAQLIYTLTLSAPVDVPVTVTVNTQNGTATTADNDYAAIVSGSAGIAAGQTTGQVAVTVNGDDRAEPHETLSAEISNLQASGRQVLLFGSQNTSGNLIANGDFELGNTAFTSGYTHSPTDLGPAGTYAVISDPNQLNGFFTSYPDHTPGAGQLMMVVNGAQTSGVVVWEQTVAVTPGTNFVFAAFLSSAHPDNPAQLQFSVNGQTIGTLNATSTTGVWNVISAPWNSGAATSATISIVNNNTAFGGNDFALDDMYFGTPTFSSASALGTIVNDDFVPVANAGGPYVIDEGDGLTLDGSGSTDADSTTLTYSWEVNGDSVYDVTTAAPVVTLTSAQLATLALNDGPASYTVTLLVSDGTNSGTDTTTLTIDNVAPTAVLATGNVTYGTNLTASLGSPFDPSGIDTSAGFHYAFGYSTTNVSTLAGSNYGNSGVSTLGNFGSVSAGTYYVFARIIDKDDGYTEYSQQVTVNKANATIVVTGYSVTYDGFAHTATGSATGVQGETLAGLDLSGTTHTNAGSYTDTWTFTDVTGNYNDASGTVLDSIAKANATIVVTGYSVTYDGFAHTATGSATGVQGETLAGLDLSGTTHTNAGSYTDTWTFTDVTGNYNDASGTVADSITQVGGTVTLVDGVLTVKGTDGNDHIHINSVNGGPGSRIRVHASFLGGNGSDGGSDGNWVDFDAALVTKIVVLAEGGDDHVTIADDITIAANIDGGTGNDKLSGGGGHDLIRGGDGNDDISGNGGNDVLVGGDGDDMIVGGNGRDVMIGGIGADKLVGNDGDDILIAGSTSHDANDLALSSIMAEWTSAHTFQQRVANLKNGTGGGTGGPQNGAIYLNASTVFGDASRDSLTGSSGTDWFIYNFTGSGPLDKANDVNSTENSSRMDI